MTRIELAIYLFNEFQLKWTESLKICKNIKKTLKIRNADLFPHFRFISIPLIAVAEKALKLDKAQKANEKKQPIVKRASLRNKKIDLIVLIFYNAEYLILVRLIDLIINIFFEKTDMARHKKNYFLFKIEIK